MSIVYRLEKQAPLTHAELDDNFRYLADAPYAFGYENWNSTDGAQAITGRTKILNNGLGPFTELAHKIPGRGNVYNPSTGQFNFDDAGLLAGDTVTFRVAGIITTTGANVEVAQGMTFAIGGFAYDLNFGRTVIKSAGSFEYARELSIYVGDSNTRDNPAEVWFESDAGGTTFELYSVFLKYELFRPVYL